MRTSRKNRSRRQAKREGEGSARVKFVGSVVGKSFWKVASWRRKEKRRREKRRRKKKEKRERATTANDIERKCKRPSLFRSPAPSSHVPSPPPLPLSRSFVPSYSRLRHTRAHCCAVFEVTSSSSSIIAQGENKQLDLGVPDKYILQIKNSIGFGSERTFVWPWEAPRTRPKVNCQRADRWLPKRERDGGGGG